MIYLTDRIVLTADQYSYISGICEKREGSGEVYISRPYRYTTVSAAVQWAIRSTLREKVGSGEIQTLKAFLEEAERLSKTIADNIRGLEL